MLADSSKNKRVVPLSNSALLRRVIGSEDDREWYPTTDEIIEAVKNDIDALSKNRKYHFDFEVGVRNPSVLDCGAGDGRVLKALTKGSKYAIEISRPLIDSLSSDIFVVGTNFHEQTLLDKDADLTFCNPPYSQFDTWATKIIKESRSSVAYLVLPRRWSNSETIKQALELRGAEAEVLLEADFIHGDRSAPRAVVDLVRVVFSYYGRISDPFSAWFDENFEFSVSNRKLHETKSSDRETIKAIKDGVEQALVKGGDMVTALVELYNKDLDSIVELYRGLEKVDGGLLAELDVNLEGLKEGLSTKFKNLKYVYWSELFDRFDGVTKRLTESKRKAMLNKLFRHTGVDFTASNAYAVAGWVIKNANIYFDEQLIDTFERLIDRANIALYKSNKKTFGDECWRWHSRPKDLDKFGLEYRIICTRTGGITGKDNYWSSSTNGLDNRAISLLDDLRVVANNLGFSVDGYGSAGTYQWESRKPIEIYCKDKRTGKEKVLMQVRAYYNGNLHIKFDQDFMCAFNVEFGRLKGWLRDHAEASSELGISEEKAKQFFKVNKAIALNQVKKLLLN